MTGPNQEEIKQEIERTREHLGETVEALAAKADVKARAQAKAADVKAQAQAKAADATTRAQAKVGELSGQVRRSEVVQRRWPLAVAAGVLVAGAVAVWRWRKK